MSNRTMKISVLGIGFDDITLEQSVLEAVRIIREEDEKAYIVTPNPEIVWMAQRDDSLREALDGARVVLPDGIGIIIGAKLLGTPLQSGRVPGIDFAAALFTSMSHFGGSIYLLGAKPGVAELAGEKLATMYPGLVIAGALDGYFKDSDEVVGKINEAKPDVLLVCLGSPKQERFMHDNLNSLHVKLCAGLGGSLDVFAGNVRRAPVFFRRLGLEWLYRLFKEPRRIKRMIKLPLFIVAVVFLRLTASEKRSND